MVLKYQLLALTLASIASLACVTPHVVYVQAGEGSFSHQAIGLLQEQTDQAFNLRFGSTPQETMETAIAASAEVFIAVRNDLVPGQWVGITVEALKSFEVVKVHDVIRMPIDMCLLRHQQAIGKQLPLTHVVSNPPALQQVTKWIKEMHLTSANEPRGTAYAAQLLSDEKLPLDTGVIGPAKAADVYPHLVVAQCHLEDRPNTFTTFIRATVAKRPIPLDEALVKAELAKHMNVEP
jgi:prephenate dehydratase